MAKNEWTKGGEREEENVDGRTDGPEGAGRGAAHPARRRAWTCGGGALARPPPSASPMARPPPCLWRAAAVTAPAGAPGPWWGWIQVQRRDRWGVLALCTGGNNWACRLANQNRLLLHCRPAAPQTHVGTQRCQVFVGGVSGAQGDPRRTKRFPVRPSHIRLGSGIGKEF